MDRASVRRNVGQRVLRTGAHREAIPWFRKTRNLIVLLIVVAAAITAAFVVKMWDSDHSRSSSSERVGSGPNRTIPDYLAANDIIQTPIQVGEPGTPMISVPLPPGWSAAEADAPPGVYVEMLYNAAADPENVPYVDILFSRLDGAADPEKVLEYATGELRNLPDYRPVSEPNPSQLSGFNAVQLSGLYAKNGQDWIIAQKTVIIPTATGLFVLQMNADAPKSEASILQQATAWIDKNATITP